MTWYTDKSSRSKQLGLQHQLVTLALIFLFLIIIALNCLHQQSPKGLQLKFLFTLITRFVVINELGFLVPLYTFFGLKTFLFFFKNHYNFI